jgi:hypothetical protein
MLAILQAAVLASSLAIPFILNGFASAEQLTDRVVLISDSVAGETGVEYDFTFTWTDASSDIEGVIIEFCDAPLGTCTKPAGMDVSYGNVALDSQANFPANATAFTEVTADTGQCNDVSANDNTETMYCVSRTEATTGAGTAAELQLSGVTNPSANTTVYIRVGLYDDAAFTGAGNRVHEGVVAAAIVDQLTINGRVQERLEFCVSAFDDGAIAGANDTTLPANVTACAALGDSVIDIGVIDDSSIAASPVDTTTTNGATDDYGILMLNTNAFNGASISYFVEDASAVSASDTDNLKAFRIIPTDCNASASFIGDGCFTSASNAGGGTAITSGTEMFGMYIACVDNNDGTRSTTANLTTVDTDYDGDDASVASDADCENETLTSGSELVAWNVGSTADTLISSSAGVDDEVVKLRFAATASSQTPTGQYTAVTTYIATATF